MSRNKNVAWFISILALPFLVAFPMPSQGAKIAFDASGKPSYGDADWVVDADRFPFRSGQSDPQRMPSPDQCTVRYDTVESYWTGGYSAWGIELVKAGHRVETIPRTATLTFGECSNAQDLSLYDVLVIPEPQEPYTEPETDAIIDFVSNGGGLFMVSNHCGSDRNNNGYDSAHVFEVMNSEQAFGIEFERDPDGEIHDYCSWNEYNHDFTDDLEDPIIHGPFGEVTQVKFNRATNIIMHPETNAAVKGCAWRNDKPHENAFVTVATSELGFGRVAAIGDSAPADDGTGDPRDDLINSWSSPNSTNRILFMNISEWLARTDVTPLPTRTPCPGSTPWPTCPPSPTPSEPTVTPSPTPDIPFDPSITIDVNEALFTEGMRFLLTLDIDNPGPSRSIDLYILLQYESLFFFYPAWTEEIDSERIILGEDTYPSYTLFDFIWPDAGRIELVTFWAGMLDPLTNQLVGNISSDTFGAL